MNMQLRDIADEVRETYVPNQEDDLPYIGLEHVEPDSLHLAGTGTSLEVESHKFGFRKGDVLFGTLRPYFRKVILAPCSGVCSTEFSVIRAKNERDRYFVFYAVALQSFIRYATTRSKGARPRTKWKLFSDFCLPAFPPTQRESIGYVLSAYDDLIENNRRRIQLLEQAARLLYKEWFVHLRFPGHEHVTITDGMPEGWEKVPLAELCTETRDSVHPRDLPPDTPYIGLEHIPRRSITLTEWADAADVDSSKFRFSEGDILFGKVRPYFHKVGFALVDGITSSDAIVIAPTDDELYHYVLFLLASDEFVALASKTVREGSKMPRADWSFLTKSKFLRPPDAVRSMFRDFVRPACDQLKCLALRNKRLGTARDLLLPRLMNGEVAV